MMYYIRSVSTHSHEVALYDFPRSSPVKNNPTWHQVVLTVHPCTTGKLVRSSVDARKKTISFFSMAVSAVLGWILPGVYQPDTLVRPSKQLKAD